MTQDQKYHRRQARKWGMFTIASMYGIDAPEHRGRGSVFICAKNAAWHAFKAHPELREAAVTK